MAESEPTVFIVDDDKGVLDALQFLLRSIGIKARTYESGQEFLDAYDPSSAGCLVLDVRMPGMSGLELQERLSSRGCALPIIFLTAHADVPMAVKAVKAGAADFIQKPFRDQELIDKIHAAIEENARIREQTASVREIKGRLATLTPREREVMDLVIDGKSNKAIAHELGLSQRTVEIHRARVMEKMQTKSVAQLVQVVMTIDE